MFGEMCEGAGTRYAPWLPNLLSGDEIREKIKFLLDEGRNRVYQDTYRLLESVHNKEN
ncbi:hypothetical protein SAMN02910292_01472 [Lachnospiraceae bacterium XBB2008]|nr:hypothetical protein SAMN02910292_01472 [Lachnospiraceae bacterium XBB2008]